MGITNQQKGHWGEQAAAEFLEKKGHTLRERNYRYRRGEIDLITEDNGTLVFVEVKLRRNTRFGTPETLVSPPQRSRINAAAEHYLYQTDWNGAIRFDIVAITAQPQLLIEHFEDVFC